MKTRARRGEARSPEADEGAASLRNAVGPETVVTVRIDAGADCSSWFKALDDGGVHFIVKARQTGELLGAAMCHEDWAIVDRGADGQPTRRVAVLDFRREDWPPGKYRVIAVRTTERYSGRQTQLWEGVDDSVQFFVTNDLHGDPNDIALRYDARAAIEGTIRELKEHFAIGSVPTGTFDANEAAFLVRSSLSTSCGGGCSPMGVHLARRME